MATIASPQNVNLKSPPDAFVFSTFSRSGLGLAQPVPAILRISPIPRLSETEGKG